MKRIKFSLLAAAALLVTIGVSAQPFGKMSSTEQAQQITEQLTRELNLDNKQAKKVEKIYTTFFDAMQNDRPQMGEFPPMGGPNGRFGGGMPPQGGRPDMGNGEHPQMNGQRPPMGPRPDMMGDEVSQSEMDKAIKKRDKNMRKILNDKQYNAWCEFERERMSRDFNRMERGQRGDEPQNGKPDNRDQRDQWQQRGQFPQR